MNKSIKTVVIKSLQIVLAIAILLILFLYTDFDFKSVFGKVQSWQYIVLALCLPLFIMPVISSNRWRLFLLKVGVNERPFILYKLSVISLFQGIILPSSQGQDFFRIYNIEKRHPDACGKVGSTILIERIIGFYVLCFLSLVFTIVVDMPNKATALLIISAITLILVAFTILILNKKLNTRLSQKKFKNGLFDRCYQYIVKFSTSMTYFPYKKVLPSSVGLILLFQLSTVATVYLIFKSFGIDLPFTTHISIYPIIAILSLVPITIGGFGVREGFFVFFYSRLGVPDDIALAVSLMNYCILTLAPAIVGNVFYLMDVITDKK